MSVNQLSTRTFLAGGAVGPVLFLAVALSLGAVQPGYDPTRHFVSLLSLGDTGWLQIANFVVTGLLIVGLGLGLRRSWVVGSGARWAPRLVVLVGTALVACGVFLGDPALGYPPGTPAGLPTAVTWHGAFHYAAAAAVFLGLSSAMAIAARRAPAASARAWALYSIVSAAIVIAGWAAAFVVTGPSGAIEVAGLLQRVAIVAGFQWLVATALIELRQARPARAPAPAYG